ncbi:MAG: carboxypeptidase regulatory-like domain-containing protein [Treponema sp.]|nr:carboxypeptidase regulatory-like domain-containing protein [Candidatus Treponema equifaecale]
MRTKKSEMQCRKIWVLIFFAGIIFSSCTTAKFDGSACLAGNVCDEEGRPVPDYRVSLNLFTYTYTNDSGIFVFHDVEAGNHRIRGKKKDFSKISKKVRFYDRKNFVHLEVAKLKKNDKGEMKK